MNPRLAHRLYCLLYTSSYAKLPRQYKALLINLQLNIVLTQSFPHVVSGLEIFHTVYILTQFIDIEIPVMFIFFLGCLLYTSQRSQTRQCLPNGDPADPKQTGQLIFRGQLLPRLPGPLDQVVLELFKHLVAGTALFYRNDF